MNNKLLDAMEQIDDEYIQSAQKWLDGVNTTNRHRGTAHRILLPLVAAVVLLLSTFTIAMATNPEFRTAVLTFFHIGEREQVPNSNMVVSGNPSITEKVIGELVNAQYIKMEGRFDYTDDNLLYQYELYELDEGIQAMRPTQFWTIEDGQVVPVDIVVNQREFSVDWRGATYQGTFDWFEWNGNIHVFHTSLTSTWGKDELEVNTEVLAIPGWTDKVMLTLALNTHKSISRYFMLYDLTSGMTEDFLDGTGVEKLDGETNRLNDAFWAEDMSGAIFFCDGENEHTEYYLDLETRILTELEALTGIEGATTVFADDRTLLLYQWGEPKVMPGPCMVTCWSYDLDTGTLTKTLNNVPLYDEFEEHPHGVFLLGNHCPYCVVVDEGGKTQMVNQVTGAVIEVENFTFSPGGDVTSNRDGTKLLYFVRNMDVKPRLQWSQLGVIDVEKGTFMAFDRDVVATAEESIFWLDDNRVAVGNYSFIEDGTTVRGLYLYEF